MDKITRRAYAKINLGLDVLKRRPDGYHEVKMIMQTVGIYDVLTFEKVTEPDDASGKERTIELVIENSDLPADRSNLIYKAAELIQQEYPACGSVKITLKKNIPIAAGMAGGSTDAAAVFHGLKELYDLPMDLQKMQELGVKLGADIPYCMMGGTALSEGIGEVLTVLPPPPQAHLCIAKPAIDVSTKFVYQNLHLETVTDHPDIDGITHAIYEQDLTGITKRLGNVLETVTIPHYPVIADLKQQMIDAGARNALMSGSGPTVFGIFLEKEKAEAAADAIRREHPDAHVFVSEFKKGRTV